MGHGLGLCDIRAMSHRLTAGALCRSLNNNQLCGLDRIGRGTYIAEGIIALTKGIEHCKALVSLR